MMSYISISSLVMIEADEHVEYWRKRFSVSGHCR